MLYWVLPGDRTKKGRRYINISKRLSMFTNSYKDRNVERDQVQIYKGRKLLSEKASDTLAVKLLGGPNLSVYVDVVKNRIYCSTRISYLVTPSVWKRDVKRPTALRNQFPTSSDLALRLILR